MQFNIFKIFLGLSFLSSKASFPDYCIRHKYFRSCLNINESNQYLECEAKRIAEESLESFFRINKKALESIEKGEGDINLHFHRIINSDCKVSKDYNMYPVILAYDAINFQLNLFDDNYEVVSHYDKNYLRYCVDILVSSLRKAKIYKHFTKEQTEKLAKMTYKIKSNKKAYKEVDKNSAGKKTS